MRGFSRIFQLLFTYYVLADISYFLGDFRGEINFSQKCQMQIFFDFFKMKVSLVDEGIMEYTVQVRHCHYLDIHLSLDLLIKLIIISHLKSSKHFIHGHMNIFRLRKRYHSHSCLCLWTQEGAICNSC